MKKTKNAEPYALCTESEIHFFKILDDDITYVKDIKLSGIQDKFLISSPSSIAMILALVFDAILIMNAVKSENYLIVFAALYFSLFASLNLFNLIIKVPILKFGSKEWREAAKMHAVMHMTVNAYNEKGSTPTFEEIKKSSYITYNCGSTDSIYKIVCAIVYLIVAPHIPNNIIWCTCIFTAIFIFFYTLKFLGFFVYFQRLIVSKPTDEDIQMIVEILDASENIEKSFYEYNDFSDDDDNK